MNARNVPGYGPRTARWAVIGEAPGYYEDQQGKPFVGKSGKLLRETLRQTGLNPEMAYITNVIKERPPANRTPKTSEIKEALPALADELASLPNLEFVLLVGAVPMQAFTGKKAVMKHRGTVKSLRPEMQDLEHLTCFATIHPAAVLRNSNYRNGWLQDLAAFGQLVHPPDRQFNWTIVDSEGAYLAWSMAQGPQGALDIETTMDQDQLISVAVTYDGIQSFVFRDDLWLMGAKPHLEETDWIMHNGYFDRSVMHTFGFDLHLAHDTMAMAYILDPDQRRGLEVLSSVWLGLPPYKSVEYAIIADLPFTEVAEMNADDASRTYLLYRALADELNLDKQLSRVYQWILMPAINALIEMTETGVPVDRRKLFELGEELATHEHLSLMKMKQTVGDEDFNPRSYQQVGRFLYDALGLPVLKLTDTGGRSTDSDTLGLLQLETSDDESIEFIDDLLEHRNLTKQLGYLVQWSDLLDDNDRLHPKYKPTSVVTGRLASEKPNIQQVPRDKRFRSIFTAPEGMTWMKADYSQVELRIAAWVSGEPTMIAAYQEGADLHRLTAGLVLGDTSDEARQVAKTLNFGLLYGGGYTTLARVARNDYGVEMSEEQAKRYRQQFFDTYPALRQWHNRVERVVQVEGKIRSPLGRIRYLPDAQIWDHEDPARHKAIREAINHPVQSFASDLMLMSLVRLRGVAKNLGAELVCEVHDEVDLLVPTGQEELIGTRVKEIMEDVSWLSRFGISLPIPVVAEIEIGPSWGELKEMT